MYEIPAGHVIVGLKCAYHDHFGTIKEIGFLIADKLTGKITGEIRPD